ncbi:MAG: esterase-like activity of phytase family protein [Acetobacteraceae bacterium]|nr:esterase-like activity of phytase family protein [Acetobacteraceae bacterium]
MNPATRPAWGPPGLCRRALLAAALAAPALPASAALAVAGVLELDTRRIGFGGLSGLWIGDAPPAAPLPLYAVSDTGSWLEASLRLDAALRPAGLEIRRTGRLADEQGRPLRRGEPSDAEALARLPDGRFLVAFERWHRIRLYDTLDAPARHVQPPPGLSDAPRNGGIEALTVLPDGRLLAIAESLSAGRGLRRAWTGRLGPRGAAWEAIAYRPAEGLEPTGAAALPDGRVLVIERGFSLLGGFAGRVALLPAVAGPVLEGPTVLAFPGALPAENWEGVAVARAGGRLVAAFVSDDNEHPLQRSLLAVAAPG